MKVIKEFKDEYRFLSNFAKAEVRIGGITYPTSEHAYMAMKSADPLIREKISRAPTPGVAKKMGRSIELRPDWEEVKESIMHLVVSTKFFSNPELAISLLNTEGYELVEGNWWNDKTWGVCLKTNQGKNLLGKILMDVREILKGSAMAKAFDKCKCGKGYASLWDNKCGHCRTKGDKERLIRMQHHAVATPGPVRIKNKYRDEATPYDVYCGRGSPLGNPFPIDERSGQTRKLVIQAYGEWLRDRIKEGDTKVCNALNDIANASLEGKPVNLVCFCAPCDCHVRIIKETVDAAVRNELLHNSQHK